MCELYYISDSADNHPNCQYMNMNFRKDHLRNSESYYDYCETHDIWIQCDCTSCCTAFKRIGNDRQYKPSIMWIAPRPWQNTPYYLVFEVV
jgi:hypothetical protein